MMDELKARKKAGFGVELISQESIKKQFGLKAKFGLLSELGAGTNAYGLTHALLQHCIKKGVRVFGRTKVTRIESNDRIVLSTDRGLNIRVKKVIQASGYEVAQFIGKKWVDFDCTYSIISEKLPADAAILKDKIVMWGTGNPYLYLRYTKDNRIIIGGMDDPFSNAFASENHLQKKYRALAKELDKLFPGIEFRVDYCWSGTFGKSKDALPYIGCKKDNRNIFYALGFGGNGIPFSLIAAEMVRDQILGKIHDCEDIFSFTR
jgi:glycine/D-amino acid oxidase-like deaminating enzyme